MFYFLTSGTNGINCWFAYPDADDYSNERQQSHRCATQQGCRGRGGWGRRAKSNQGRVFESEGEARTDGLGAFSASVKITCRGLKSRLLRELWGVLLQQDHTQTGLALPLCTWRKA